MREPNNGGRRITDFTEIEITESREMENDMGENTSMDSEISESLFHGE